MTFSAAVCVTGLVLAGASRLSTNMWSWSLSLSLSLTHTHLRKHTHAHCPHDLWMTPHVTLQRNTRLIREQIITNIEIQTYLC